MYIYSSNEKAKNKTVFHFDYLHNIPYCYSLILDFILRWNNCIALYIFIRKNCYISELHIRFKVVWIVKKLWNQWLTRVVLSTLWFKIQMVRFNFIMLINCLVYDDNAEISMYLPAILVIFRYSMNQSNSMCFFFSVCYANRCLVCSFVESSLMQIIACTCWQINFCKRKYRPSQFFSLLIFPSFIFQCKSMLKALISPSMLASRTGTKFVAMVLLVFFSQAKLFFLM